MAERKEEAAAAKSTDEAYDKVVNGDEEESEDPQTFIRLVIRM